MNEDLQQVLKDLTTAAQSAQRTVVYALIGLAAFWALKQYAQRH